MSYADKLFGKVPYVKSLLENCPQELIFHYTKPAKLLAMLEGGKLRFSNALYLNDKEEVTYSYQLILSLLEENKSLNPILKEKIQTRFKNKSFGPNDDITYNYEYYTISFSTNPDNLTLWNNYSKDKVYTGYNIGFDKKLLIEDMIKNEYSPIYGAIIYNQTKQIEIINFILNKWNSKIERALNTKKYLQKHDNTKIIALLIEIIDILSIVSIFFKNPHFKDEQEYRIVLVNNFAGKNARQIKICEKNGLFVPYIEFAYSKDSVKAVNIGPTLNENIFKTSTERMLLNFGYKNTLVKQSKIPLRY